MRRLFVDACGFPCRLYEKNISDVHDFGIDFYSLEPLILEAFGGPRVSILSDFWGPGTSIFAYFRGS